MWLTAATWNYKKIYGLRFQQYFFEFHCKHGFKRCIKQCVISFQTCSFSIPSKKSHMFRPVPSELLQKAAGPGNTLATWFGCKTVELGRKASLNVPKKLEMVLFFCCKHSEWNMDHVYIFVRFFWMLRDVFKFLGESLMLLVHFWDLKGSKNGPMGGCSKLWRIAKRHVTGAYFESKRNKMIA